MRLRYAAVSDVGRVRRDNQDSGYAGPYLLAIADGVGGSARGDVASAATVEVVRRLDERPTGGAEELLSALAGAIHRSHDRIAELVAEHPEIDGTSSTATAAVFDGTLLGIGHVGDSRGYLLREGSLSQLTTDHTFVQSLIDEGRITEDEARVHPHRNLILRAVDGVHEPEPDVFTLEASVGDRVLLCSDGCSGVLEPDRLTALLGEGSPEEAADALVRAALDAGSTDNVTVVVADVEEGDPEQIAPLVVGAAAESARRPPGGAPAAASASDTGELPLVTDGSDADLDPEEARYAPRAPQRFAWARRTVGGVVVLLLLGLIALAGYRWSQDQYFVSNSGDQVVIYQGVQADVPGLSLHKVHERTLYVLDDLPSYRQRQVRDGISASSLTDARAVVQSLRTDVTCPSPSPSPSPSATASRKAGQKGTKASASPSPTPSPSPSPSASSGPASTRTPAVCQSPTPSPSP